MPLRTTLEQWRLRRHIARHQRRRDGRVLAGHHHHNVVVRLREPLASLVRANPGDLVTIRTRRPSPDVVLRAWQNEAAVVSSLLDHMPDLPRPLRPLRDAGRAVYTYLEGTTLAERAPVGSPVSEDTMRRIAALFGRLATVPRDRLPRLPHSAGWPEDGDSAGFLAHLAKHAETHLHQANRPCFGALLDDLDFPHDAVQRFENLAKSLTPRPFGLLHTDIHRSNLLERPGGGLTLVDWELALYGDPLHDLATHLVRMGYTPDEQARMTAMWQEEMTGRGLGDRLAGMGGPTGTGDLARYVDFEYAQSVHADTIRAALALPRKPTPSGYAAAAAAVQRALSKAGQSLGMERVPTKSTVEEALRAWHPRFHPLARKFAGAVRRPAVRR